MQVKISKRNYFKEGLIEMSVEEELAGYLRYMVTDKSWIDNSEIESHFKDNIISVELLYIAPEFRSKGLGRKLVQSLLDTFEKGEFYLYAFPIMDDDKTCPLEKDQLINFYKSIGFRLIDDKHMILTKTLQNNF